MKKIMITEIIDEFTDDILINLEQAIINLQEFKEDYSKIYSNLRLESELAYPYDDPIIKIHLVGEREENTQEKNERLKNKRMHKKLKEEKERKLFEELKMKYGE